MVLRKNCGQISVRSDSKFKTSRMELKIEVAQSWTSRDCPDLGKFGLPSAKFCYLSCTNGSVCAS
jgi:hypothetical protein